MSPYHLYNHMNACVYREKLKQTHINTVVREKEAHIHKLEEVIDSCIQTMNQQNDNNKRSNNSTNRDNSISTGSTVSVHEHNNEFIEGAPIGRRLEDVQTRSTPGLVRDQHATEQTGEEKSKRRTEEGGDERSISSSAGPGNHTNRRDNSGDIGGNTVRDHDRHSDQNHAYGETHSVGAGRAAQEGRSHMLSFAESILSGSMHRPDPTPPHPQTRHAHSSEGAGADGSLAQDTGGGHSDREGGDDADIDDDARSDLIMRLASEKRKVADLQLTCFEWEGKVQCEHVSVSALVYVLVLVCVFVYMSIKVS